jgi:hypothetical protein
VEAGGSKFVCPISLGSIRYEERLLSPILDDCDCARVFAGSQSGFGELAAIGVGRQAGILGALALEMDAASESA